MGVNARLFFAQPGRFGVGKSAKMVLKMFYPDGRGPQTIFPPGPADPANFYFHIKAILLAPALALPVATPYIKRAKAFADIA
jgi:hypothetical protein